MKTRAGDLADRDVHGEPRQPQPARQRRDEEPCVDRKEQHLEDRVEGDEAGGVFGVAGREVVPHDHHRDAARQPDDDHPGHVLGIVAQEQYGEREHQHRPDEPVLDERQRQHAAVPEDRAELLVPHLRERRVHHQDQPDGDRQRRRPDAHPVERRTDTGEHSAGGDAGPHREEDPEREIPVQPRQPRPECRSLGGGKPDRIGYSDGHAQHSGPQQLFA